MDRLASWVHWGWDPDGAAAVLLMALHTDLDAKRLRQRARQEEVGEALELLEPLASATEPVSHEQLRRLRVSLETT